MKLVHWGSDTDAQIPEYRYRAEVTVSRKILSHDDAVESIEAIRTVLERTTRYTHISWLGVLGAGSAAVLAALAGRLWEILPGDNPGSFLLLWTGALATALIFGLWTTARRARSFCEPLWSRKLQIVSAGFLPALVFGFVVTALLTDVGRLELAPGLWMGIYGVGILAVAHVLDGEFQVTAWVFLLSSAISLFFLRSSPHAAMILTFGGIHLGLTFFRFFKEHPWQRT